MTATQENHQRPQSRTSIEPELDLPLDLHPASEASPGARAEDASSAGQDPGVGPRAPRLSDSVRLFGIIA